VYPVILSRLFNTIGFRWATRALGFVTVAELVTALAIMLPYTRKLQHRMVHRRSVRDLFNSEPFRDKGFMGLSFAFLFLWIGYWVISFFIPTFATFKLGATDTEAVNFLVIFNACSILGRIIPVVVASRWGVPRATPWFAFASGILLMSWALVRTTTAYYVWVVLISILLTPLAVLCPSMLAHVSPSQEVMGTRMGISFGFMSFGVLIGIPVSSSFIDRETGSFWRMQIFTGVAMIIGGALMVYVAQEVTKKATKLTDTDVD
jgi:fucose permease